MANKKTLFDASKTAGIIADLRNGDNKERRNYTQKELCDEIQNNFDVSLSVSKLSRLEKGDTSQIPSINILLAIADFFDVSLEYLIGRAEVATPSLSRKATNKKFGLSDEAMDAMENMNKYKDIGLLPANYRKCSEMAFVNKIIVNFRTVILSPAIEYFIAYENYMDFIEKYGRGKKSQKYLDLDGLPVGIEDSLIDECQELKEILDIKRMNILSELECFLKRLRNALIIKKEDNNADN